MDDGEEQHTISVKGRAVPSTDESGDRFSRINHVLKADDVLRPQREPPLNASPPCGRIG
jgi:hypothetical protein